VGVAIGKEKVVQACPGGAEVKRIFR